MRYLRVIYTAKCYTCSEVHRCAGAALAAAAVSGDSKSVCLSTAQIREGTSGGGGVAKLLVYSSCTEGSGGVVIHSFSRLPRHHSCVVAAHVIDCRLQWHTRSCGVVTET